MAKNPKWKPVIQKYDGQKLLEIVTTQILKAKSCSKQSDSKKFNSSKPDSKKCGEKRSHLHNGRWLLVLQEKYDNKKCVINIFFSTKCLKNKSYRAKNWLPKILRWIFLWKKRKCKSFKSKSKIYIGKGFDEKSFTVESETTAIFHEENN